MKYYVDTKFWDYYKKLNPDIRKMADKSFNLLKNDMHHLAVKLKKLTRSNHRSARVGPNYRVLGVDAPSPKKEFYGYGLDLMSNTIHLYRECRVNCA